MSSVTFGYFDGGHIKEGLDALNWFPNRAIDTWVLLLKDLEYADQELQTGGTKRALVDSSGLYIQVPMNEFK